MEVNKILKNIKLSRKEREINYWTEQYDLVIMNLNKSFKVDNELINQNKTQIDKLKVKYSFYEDLVNLTLVARDKNSLKRNTVQLIISYLEIVYENGNIILQKGNIKSISKKSYSTEKKKILKDLRLILKEAIYYRVISDLNDRQKNKIKLFKLTTPRNKHSVPAEEIQNGLENVKSYNLKLSAKKKKIYEDEVKNSSASRKSIAPLRPGRKKYSILAFYALKYHVIRKFHKSQNPYLKESEYSSLDQFYKRVSEKEGLNRGSFRNKYKEIQKMGDLEEYCKSKPEVVKALLNSDIFSKEKYPECFDFLAQFNLKSE